MSALNDKTQSFIHRHIGPRVNDVQKMCKSLEVDCPEDLINNTVPDSIVIKENLSVGQGMDEQRLLTRLRKIASENSVFRSYIGMGYHGTVTPSVILRNILENPGWYTQYTPYQAEISQGRLEALLNFQTMISDFTGLPIANASLLDEATAAAEAMIILYRSSPNKNTFLVSDQCHPQTLAVLYTRSKPLNINLVIESHENFKFSDDVFGIFVQYPASDGAIYDYTALFRQAHDAGIFCGVSADILSLALLRSPGEFGADIAVGTTQRFGVPMGFGGPHAAYLATTELFKRKIPGRIIGISKDRHGNPALRMALQTREQHIRRERATSNICTAQVLLAIMAGMYAVYHGPEGIRAIAGRVHGLTKVLEKALLKGGHILFHKNYFDTLRIKPRNLSTAKIQSKAKKHKINFRNFNDESIGISLDETTTYKDILDITDIFNVLDSMDESLVQNILPVYDGSQKRTSEFLTHPVFHRYQSETEMLRYIHRLEIKDLSLNTSMIPLGSCTMKLNAVTEMLPITWPEFSAIHPFSPKEQTAGYQTIINELSSWLCSITGLDACSLQPNSGSQGEYAGLLTIREYHKSRGESQRNVCLIPSSAHGTNPASAVMAGMKVVIVNCDENGNINIKDLITKAKEQSKNLAAAMVTYPSTHGVFEEGIREICQIIHEHGGQVYLDGANLNAMVGLSRLGDFGADVCHINLHKTFAIPHGGGGPGMGPICTAIHLSEFLPNHSVNDTNYENITTISAAPYGSAGILPISWAYIAMLGDEGLRDSTVTAILNANYMAKRLAEHYPILYKGIKGFVAHEFIVDLRPLKKESGITDEDVAKRLMDYGFHAPTMSFPVPGTLMIEPTESESKTELDRFCDAMISIKKETQHIINGTMDKADNPLKNAPHTAIHVTSDDWHHSYSRQQAVYPAPWLKDHKYWPTVGRVDNALGDRNLICTCIPIEDYEN